MPNAFGVKDNKPGSTNIDRRARALCVKLFGSSGDSYGGGINDTTDIITYVSQIHVGVGSDISWAYCGTPKKDPGINDTTPGVALRQISASTMRLLGRACVYYQDEGGKQIYFNGWALHDTHSGYEDSLITYVVDDRWIMQTYYTCFGKMCYDPGPPEQDSSGNSSYTSAKTYFLSNPNDPLIFNNYGWGDCLDTPLGPFFAPGHRYGHLSTGSVDPNIDPPVGQAGVQTRKFQVSDVLSYLRTMFYARGLRPSLGKDFGLINLPTIYIDWPEDLASCIVENRTPHSMRLENMNLLQALITVISYAGPYELCMEPVDDTQSKMKIVDHSYRAANTGNEINIYSPDTKGSLVLVADDAFTVYDFQITRSAEAYASQIRLVGDSSTIELLASTDPDDSELPTTGAVDGGVSVADAAPQRAPDNVQPNGQNVNQADFASNNTLGASIDAEIQNYANFGGSPSDLVPDND